MKKLLYFASDFNIGLSALLTDQLISLSRSGANVIAVAGEKEQEEGLAKRLEQNNVPIIRINGLDVHADFKKLVTTLKNIVVRYDVRIIHVQNNWQLALAGTVKNLLRFQKKVEIIYTLHGFRHNHPVKAKIAQFVIGSSLLMLADYVICMTEYLRGKFKLLDYKIHIIPLGVNDRFFSETFETPSTESLRLIYPAQFRHGKNQDSVIKAFADYCNLSGDITATLQLPGNGPLLDSMKSLAKKLGVDNQVYFPGLLSKERIREEILASNISIVASNSETFGQSIVEPYVLGRCVVSTPVGIALEIIGQDNGYLFRSPSDLTRILMGYSVDKEALFTQGQNNYNHRDTFRWEEISKKYMKEFLV